MIGRYRYGFNKYFGGPELRRAGKK